MAKINWGREGRVYVKTFSELGFSVSGAIEVRRTKDITTSDEAKTATAEARDLEYDVNQQAGKTFQLEFEMLIEKLDNGTDAAFLRDAYINATDIFVVVCRGKKDVASGDAILFAGQVMQFPDGMPNGEASSRTVIIKPSHPDFLPTRVTTPLS